MKITYESVDVTKNLTPEKLSWSWEGENRDWKVNQELPADTFELEFPKGVTVVDHRLPPARPSELPADVSKKGADRKK